MSLYVRSKVLFVGEPEVLERITREVEENGETISFGRILPLNGADPEEVWGVPGEAEETDRILYRNRTYLEYSFDTEDSAPEAVYRALAERYPEPEMTARYASEDIGEDCGIWEAGEGSGEAVFREPDDPFLFACEVWDRDPDEEMNERAINFYEE